MRAAGFVVVALLLSGCTDAPAEPDGPALVTLDDGSVVRSDLAAVAGTVSNDAGLPVSGAFVRLVGDAASVRTDAEGRYRLFNVSAGAQTLRVEADGFAALEEDVELPAGNLTRHDVLLLPDASRGAGYQAHVHDYWAGEDVLTLMDADVLYNDESDILTVGGQPNPDYIARNPNMMHSDAYVWIPVPERDETGRPNLVFPGTARVEVTVTWETQSSTLSEMGLAYRAVSGDRVDMDPLPSGQTFSIDVTPEMADSGHQYYTFWDFYLYPGNQVGNADWEPGLIYGPFQVKIEVFRGAPILEPPHPDFWADGDTISFTITDSQNINPRSSRSPERHPTGYFPMPDDRLVPPGTVRMHIEFSWVYGTLDEDLKETPADMPFTLTWLTAEQNPRTTPLSEYKRVDGEACGDHCRIYDYEVPAAETDAFYQSRSGWLFLASVEGYQDESRFSPEPRGDKEFRLDITLSRSP